jgi:tetratricopeptide (TPR) repeat protein
MKKLISFIILSSLFFGCSSSPKKQTAESTPGTTQPDLVISKENLSALGHCLKGDVSKGLSELRKNVDDQKRSPGYWSHVGHCYYLKADNAKAKYFYKLSLSLDKTDQQALLGVALLQVRNKEYTEAAKSLNFLIKTYPTLVDAKFNLSQIYFYFSDYDSSLNLLEQVFAAGLKDQDGLTLKMKNYVYKSQYQDALKLCNEIENAFGVNTEVSNYKSYIYYKQGKFEESRALLVGGRSLAQEKNIGKKDVQLSFRDQLSNLVMKSLTKKGVE